jgi:hypothetical protein
MYLQHTVYITTSVHENYRASSSDVSTTSWRRDLKSLPAIIKPYYKLQTNHLPPTSAEVKNAWTHTYTPPKLLHGAGAWLRTGTSTFTSWFITHFSKTHLPLYISLVRNPTKILPPSHLLVRSTCAVHLVFVDLIFVELPILV